MQNFKPHPLFTALPLQSGLNLQPPDDCHLKAQETNVYNLVMVNVIRARDPHGLNKGRGLRFRVGS